MYSSTIEKLIKLFSRFPTVGPRTAARFVFYLIKQPKEQMKELLKSIEELQNKIKICSWCCKSFEASHAKINNSSGSSMDDRSYLNHKENNLCPICADPRRDKSLVCLVEKEEDLEAIEKTNQFKGLYFILGGTMGLKSEQQKKTLEDRFNGLIERIKNGTILRDRSEMSQIKEVILALNPTTEGQNTALWLRRKLESTGVRVTQLGRGLPVGGELEYADEETLSSALTGRK